jgi:hypothetical protein
VSDDLHIKPKTCKKNRHIVSMFYQGPLAGVTVSVLATEPKGRWFKPGRGDGFLRVIIRSTPSFGWEVKPEVQRRKVLHAKDPLSYFRY